MMIAAGQQRCPGWRAQRRHVEPVVPGTLLSDPGQGWCADRTAERIRVPETSVIDQDQQHIGRPLGRADVSDQVPGWGRSGQCPVRHTPETRIRERQPGPVNLRIRHDGIGLLQSGCLPGSAGATIYISAGHDATGIIRCG
jgi:hypothetical protein